MRAARIAGLVVASLAGLVLAALALTWWLFDPNAYKDELRTAFRDATGRELRLDGPLSLSFFPWLAVEMGAAAISNREGFGDEPFASIDHARLGVRLWPLVARRHVEFGPVRVDGLDVNLAVARNGTDNWSDLVDRFEQAEAAEPDPQEATSEPADLSVASVTLRDARLRFADAQAGTRYAIERWSLATGRLHRGEPFDLDTALHAARNGKPLGEFDVHTRVDLSQREAVTFEDIRGQVRLPRADRKALEADVACPRIALDNTTRNIAVDALVAKVGAAQLTTTLEVRQGKGGPQASGELELAEVHARKLFESLGVDLPRTQDPQALGRLAARSKVRYSSARGLVLDALDLRLDDTHLTGRVSVADFDRMPVRFDLRGDALDLDRYLPAKGAAPPAKQDTPAPAPASSTGGVRSLDVQGSLALGKLVAAAMPLADVDADLRLRNGQFTLDPLRARAFGGRTVTRARYDLAAAVPALEVDLVLEGVDVAAMLGQLLDVRQLEGRGTAHFELATSGANPAEMFANLRGPFELTVTDGALVGADMWYEIERALAAVQLKGSAVTAKGTGRTDFDRFAARGTLAERTLRNERLEFDTDFARVRGRGNVAYGAGTVDLDLVARLLRTPPGRLLGVKVSRLKDADIPLRVTGKLTEPKVRPDVSRLLEAIARDALTQPFEGKVKEQLEKIFKF